MEKLDLEAYNKSGYLIFKKFFSQENINSILLDAKSVFHKQFLSKGISSASSVGKMTEDEFNNCLFSLFEKNPETLINCGKQVQHLISLHRLSVDEKIEQLLYALGLKSPNISTRPVAYFNHKRLAKKSVYYKVDAHQDWRSMQGSLNSVVIWVPLIDVNKDLGALEVIPGSHLDGLRTNHIDAGFGMVNLSKEDIDKFVTVELEQGDILLFSSFLIHQSGENVTDKPRWSCHFRYNDLSEQSFINRNFAHAYIYRPQEELITSDFPDQEQVRAIFS